ncbi:IS66 family insertion sequence element accessory protein TnpB (plasmid) [Microvirga sp. RSM25]|uniref:IS66 family insertion sequence element accessory protein TnpB n=1 Tax=Microvirga sp. RSM25 TaxID=3273802 RepID=UPI00384DC002
MIGPTGAVRVLVATKPVDFRKGADGLAALVRDTMGADPFLCVVRDYVAAGSLTVEFQHFAAPSRHIIIGSRAVEAPRPLP